MTDIIREGFEVKVTEAINMRVPIIASDAGGIPLQVKNGENGWIVPSGDSKAVSSLLMDIYTGKEKIKRDISSDQKLDNKDNAESDKQDGSKSDPNAFAEAFVRDFKRPMIPIKADKASTSEDFWTVGNATKWMLLTSRVLGLGIDAGQDGGKGTRALLQEMGVGKALERKEENVWKIVMGGDLVEGEGAIREHQ